MRMLEKPHVHSGDARCGDAGVSAEGRVSPWTALFEQKQVVPELRVEVDCIRETRNGQGLPLPLRW